MLGNAYSSIVNNILLAIGKFKLISIITLLKLFVKVAPNKVFEYLINLLN